MVTTTKKIEYFQTNPFQKDLKRLLKKYRTLEEDLEMAKRAAIELFHLKNLDNNSVFLIKALPKSDIKIFKIKKFACRALKGSGAKSGIRVIYAYDASEDKVVFIEIYHKSEKENEDQC